MHHPYFEFVIHHEILSTKAVEKVLVQDEVFECLITKNTVVLRRLERGRRASSTLTVQVPASSAVIESR